MDWVNCLASMKGRVLHSECLWICVTWIQQHCRLITKSFELSGRHNYFLCFPLWIRWIVAGKIGWRSLCLVLCVQNIFLLLLFWNQAANKVLQLENENVFGNVEGVNIIENDMITAAERYDQTVHQVIGRECVQYIKSNEQQFLFKVTAVKCVRYEAVKQWLHCSGQKKRVTQEMIHPTVT